MRILTLFTSTIRGGAEELALLLSGAASTEGWESVVAFPHAPGNRSLVEDFQAAGVTVRYLAVPERGVNETKLGTAVKALRTWRLVRSVSPNVVVIHLPWQTHAFPSLLGVALTGIPSVLLFHLAPRAMKIEPKRMKGYRYARSRGQVWIAVSTYTRDRVAESFSMERGDVKVIRNGIHHGSVRVARECARARLLGKMGLDEGNRLVLTVGRLDRVKGLDDVIPAIPYVLERFPETRFLWAGEGPLRSVIEAKLAAYGVQDKVLLLGRRTDIAELLAASDLFLFPSHAEGLSLALLEAAASGIPIIASDCTSNPEVIHHMRNGLLFRTGDPCNMLEWLLWALGNMPAMRGFSARAKSDIEGFSEEKMLREHLDLYRNIAKSARRESK